MLRALATFDPVRLQVVTRAVIPRFIHILILILIIMFITVIMLIMFIVLMMLMMIICS